MDISVKIVDICRRMRPSHPCLMVVLVVATVSSLEGRKASLGSRKTSLEGRKNSLEGRKTSLEDLLVGDRDPRDGTHPNSVYSKIDLHHKKEKQTGELQIFYQTGVSKIFQT